MKADDSRTAVDVIDGGAFADLADEWDDLLAHSEAPTVFLTWAWISSWRETLGRDQRLLIATARRSRDGLLVGIAPMAVGRRIDGHVLRYRALQFAGGGAAASDHLDLVIRTGYGSIAEALWSAIEEVGGWDVYALDGLRPGSRLAAIMAQSPGYKARYVELMPCPAITLPDTWETYEASLGSNLRRNLRRYARKLAEESGESVDVRLITDPGEVDETICELVNLHLKAYSAKGSESTFARDSIVDFHRLAARRFLEAGMLRMYRLDVGTSVVAVDYCYAYDGVVSSFQSGYDMDWSQYGPGRQIVADAVRAAIEEGAHTFDFLRGDEEYKQAWLAETVWDERIWMPASPLGKAIVPIRALARSASRRFAPKDNATH